MVCSGSSNLFVRPLEKGEVGELDFPKHSILRVSNSDLSWREKGEFMLDEGWYRQPVPTPDR